MSYQQRLNWFLMWADHYGLKLYRGFEYDESDRSWAQAVKLKSGDI